MKVFWNDCGEGAPSDSPVELTLSEVQLIWSDGSGVEGNFLGLVDDRGRTIQFYFTAGIPDDVEDARHLKIVLMDFPVQEKRGSYSKLVTIDEVHDLIALAFDVGVNHQSFSGVNFSKW